MNAKESMERFYAGENEEARLLSRHGQVEYRTTMRFIERYLQTGMRVADIGAGTGRYALALARQGCAVDAVELVESNLSRLRENARAEKSIRAFQGDAIALDFLPSGAYDIVLLLGPLYHLFSREERERALSEAVRLARPGGVIFAAYCLMDASILGYGFMRGHVQELLEKGLLDTERFIARSRPEEVFQLSRVEDIEALAQTQPVERLHLVATDLATLYMRDCVDAMDDDTFALYLKYHFFLCERRDMIGASHHVLDVLRKRELTGQ